MGQAATLQKAPFDKLRASSVNPCQKSLTERARDRTDRAIGLMGLVGPMGRIRPMGSGSGAVSFYLWSELTWPIWGLVTALGAGSRTFHQPSLGS